MYEYNARSVGGFQQSLGMHAIQSGIRVADGARVQLWLYSGAYATSPH